MAVATLGAFTFTADIGYTDMVMMTMRGTQHYMVYKYINEFGF